MNTYVYYVIWIVVFEINGKICDFDDHKLPLADAAALYELYKLWLKIRLQISSKRGQFMHWTVV